MKQATFNIITICKKDIKHKMQTDLTIATSGLTTFKQDKLLESDRLFDPLEEAIPSSLGSTSRVHDSDNRRMIRNFLYGKNKWGKEEETSKLHEP